MAAGRRAFPVVVALLVAVGALVPGALGYLAGASLAAAGYSSEYGYDRASRAEYEGRLALTRNSWSEVMP